MSLVQQDGSYRLVQTPIDAYKNLRETDKAIFLKDVTVAQENNLLKGFKGDQYEIVSTFRPSATTKKIGFNLRVGNGEVTRVVYDLEKVSFSRKNLLKWIANLSKEMQMAVLTYIFMLIVQA